MIDTNPRPISRGLFSPGHCRFPYYSPTNCRIKTKGKGGKPQGKKHKHRSGSCGFRGTVRPWVGAPDDIDLWRGAKPATAPQNLQGICDLPWPVARQGFRAESQLLGAVYSLPQWQREKNNNKKVCRKAFLAGTFVVGSICLGHTDEAAWEEKINSILVVQSRYSK